MKKNTELFDIQHWPSPTAKTAITHIKVLQEKLGGTGIFLLT